MSPVEERNRTLVQNLLQTKSRAGIEAVEQILQTLQLEHDAVLEYGTKHPQILLRKPLTTTLNGG